MILIRMDMPKSCHDCPLQDYEYGRCNVPGGEDIDFYMAHKSFEWTVTRSPNCPLIDFGNFVEGCAQKIFEAFPFAHSDYFNKHKEE